MLMSACCTPAPRRAAAEPPSMPANPSDTPQCTRVSGHKSIASLSSHDLLLTPPDRATSYSASASVGGSMSFSPTVLSELSQSPLEDMVLSTAQLHAFPQLAGVRTTMLHCKDRLSRVFDESSVRKLIWKIKEQQSILLSVSQTSTELTQLQSECKRQLKALQALFSPSTSTSDLNRPVLTVRVKQAKGLNRSNGLQDVLCSLSVIDQPSDPDHFVTPHDAVTVRTAVAKQDPDPKLGAKWGTTEHNFLLDEQSNHLRIIVYNARVTHFLGYIEVPVPSLTARYDREEWRNLKRRGNKYSDQVNGILLIHVSVAPINRRFTDIPESCSPFDSALMLGLHSAVVTSCKSTHRSTASGTPPRTPRAPRLPEDALASNYSAVWATPRTGVFSISLVAPVVFREIRRFFGYTDEEFIVSMCGGALRSLGESKGKSGASFYRTHDGRLFLKTLEPSEHMLLLSMLESYHGFMTSHSKSFLQQFYGCVTLKLDDLTARFVILNNVFDTPNEIHAQFDLKGSSQGRKVTQGALEEYMVNGHSSVILKDLDFENAQVEVLFDKGVRHQVLVQLDKDAKFLQGHSIMDYSLLLGMHHLSLASRDQVNNSADSENAELVEDMEEDMDYGSAPRASLHKRQSQVELLFKRVSSRFFSKPPVHRKALRRTTPRCGVPIPLANGDIAFMGIIDILQTYNTKKKLEAKVKNLVWEDISCVPPDKYATRFCSFMNFVLTPRKDRSAHLNQSTFRWGLFKKKRRDLGHRDKKSKPHLGRKRGARKKKTRKDKTKQITHVT